MENRKSIGLPGGPNEFLKEITQHISVEGYKRYSKDVNNPYNIIESGNITMEDVDFPVKGTDNLGNEQMMMPGMNYQFPGDQVFEVPMAQAGKELTGDGGWLPETVVNRFAMSQDEKDYRVKERAALSKYQKDIKDAEDLGQLYPDRVQALKQLAEENYMKNRGPAYVNPRTAEPQPELRPYEAPSATRQLFNRLANPITTFGYAARGEMEPDLITRGNNAYDYIADLRNPFSLGEAAYDAAASYREDDYLGMGLNALGAIPALPFSGKQAKAAIQNTFPESISKIGFSKNNRERLGALVGIPPERSLPRLSSEELKIYRQVQDIGKMRATGKPMSEQYKYALEKGIPEQHLQRLFNKSKADIENIIPTTEADEALRAQRNLMPIEERFNLQRIPRRSLADQRMNFDLMVDSEPLPNLQRSLRRSQSDQMIDVMNNTRSADYNRDNVIRHTLSDADIDYNIQDLNYLSGIPTTGVAQNMSLKDRLYVTNAEIQKSIYNAPQSIRNKISGSQNYPYYQGSVSENVPSLSLSGSGSLKNVSDKVTSQSNLGINSGDVFTGSLNTSHSSYLPQLKQVFKYQDGSPQFLGYKGMNSMGFLSDYNYSHRDIGKYLNTEIDAQIKRGIIPNDIQRPYIKNNSLMLPQYGIKQKQYGGEEELPIAQTGLGFDWGGYFSGEQGWIPDYNGIPTLQMFDEQPVKQEVVEDKSLKIIDKPKEQVDNKVYYNPNILNELSETQKKRRQSLLNGANVIANSQDNNESLRRLLTLTAGMENTLGVNADAYGRDYTKGPMSIDDNAFKDLFEPRGENGKYTASQKKNFEWLKTLGFDHTKMNEVLMSDDHIAGMAVARMVYGRSPEALPDASDSKALYKYYSDYYNKGGMDKYGGSDEHLERWNKLYNDLYNFSNGGETDMLSMYSNYIGGAYDGTKMEKKASKVYDKLNRMHYRDAKVLGMSPANYILTHVIGKA